MRRYVVMAHRTIGGAHLYEHLHELRKQDPYCRFHVLVPRYHPPDHPWTDVEVEAAAWERLDATLELMASMGMGASGEIGDANPVYAVEDLMRRLGGDTFTGIVVSTLPKRSSEWWRQDVPKRIRRRFPELEVTHIVAAEDAEQVDQWTNRGAA